jgi:hypothetical protein
MRGTDEPSPCGRMLGTTPHATLEVRMNSRGKFACERRIREPAHKKECPEMTERVRLKASSAVVPCANTGVSLMLRWADAARKVPADQPSDTAVVRLQSGGLRHAQHDVLEHFFTYKGHDTPAHHSLNGSRAPRHA